MSAPDKLNMTSLISHVLPTNICAISITMLAAKPNKTGFQKLCLHMVLNKKPNGTNKATLDSILYHCIVLSGNARSAKGIKLIPPAPEAMIILSNKVK